ncbi:MAG: hypothetical protein JKY56_25240, partial [Kofleriaceae bacterium]|nr:hypothetical protein [Kofleriaceae bacterium]
MITTKNFRTLLASAALIALPLTACQQDSFDDADSIAEQLQLDNGGLDMEDEAPLFGESDLFADAQFAEELDLSDAMADDAEVVAMAARSDAMRVDAVIRWGQLPFRSDISDDADWSGRLRVNRGAIIVRRSMGFRPDRDDQVEGRDQRDSVRFRSLTRRGSAGLRITLIDPTPNAEEPFRLEFVGDGGTEYTVDVRDILAGPTSYDVGERGDRIVVVAQRRHQDEQDCSRGFLRGRWHQVAPHRGRLLGQVRDGDGDLIGHMRGVYGERDNGNKVFFGKYIGDQGGFRGLFAGRYQEGHFRGVWLNRDGEVGALGGAYRDRPDDQRLGGHYLGRWASNSCNVQVGPGVDMPERPDP